jgi:hypothetical protein
MYVYIYILCRFLWHASSLNSKVDHSIRLLEETMRWDKFWSHSHPSPHAHITNESLVCHATNDPQLLGENWNSNISKTKGNPRGGVDLGQCDPRAHTWHENPHLQEPVEALGTRAHEVPDQLRMLFSGWRSRSLFEPTLCRWKSDVLCMYAMDSMMTHMFLAETSHRGKGLS